MTLMELRDAIDELVVIHGKDILQYEVRAEYTYWYVWALNYVREWTSPNKIDFLRDHTGESFIGIFAEEFLDFAPQGR